MAEYESWLKRMEHGSIGETRTKELLIDRFWILERSVDIQGADYIIQRRLTEQNVLDFNPHRFGVVQAKFIQDEKTSIYIDHEYVQDSYGSPRDEFFLLIHTGKEDSKKTFFLTASEIKHQFKICEQQSPNAGKYRIPGYVLIRDRNFLVDSIKKMNDCIEQALIRAELMKNRIFIYEELNQLNPPDKSDIIDKFTVDLHNYYCDIPITFFKLKSTAFRVLDNIESVASILRQMVNEKDPRKFMSLSEELSSDMNGSGYIQFQVGDLSFDDDLFNVIVEHELLASKLSDVGKLEYFEKIKKSILEELTKMVSAEWNTSLGNTILYLTINYDPSALSEPSFLLETVSNVSESSLEVSWLEFHTIGRVKAGVYWKRVGNSYGPRGLDGQAKSISNFIFQHMDEIIIEDLLM